MLGLSVREVCYRRARMRAPALELELRLRPSAWEPWLVYADWLSERGDVRGRLIALEHHRATSRLRPDEQRAIATEIDELIAAHQADWLIPDMPEACKFEWRYGFITGVAFPLAEEYLGELQALLEHPQARLLSALRLRAPEGEDDGEFDEEAFEQGYAPDPIAEQLLVALFDLDLSQINTLAIEYSAIGRQGAKLLGACPTLAQLRALDLRYGYLDDEAIELLTGAAVFDQVRSLKLQRNRIGPAGARALAAAPAFTRLTTLDLRENPLGQAGAEALAGSANLAQLNSLYLYFDDVGLEGARALSTSPHLPFEIRRQWAGLWSAHDVRASTS
jgi:uncharacterized protein (TIGR02996 family)